MLTLGEFKELTADWDDNDRILITGAETQVLVAGDGFVMLDEETIAYEGAINLEILWCAEDDIIV